ncbi:glycerate kinase [Ramlibacter sp. H39-3-26]|uniref:glycerate kinase n=1 Tax=Curvibacter soli TaxID=3031331 RepID=UPI0023DAE1C1|nr:glycerate kinase [Ramlibacter sp. H39-3-26]MDF1486073.1 glycerate kinase [Ramlibacter sp. H39-3-26]
MNLTRILVPLGCLALLAAAWRAYGWMGAAGVAGGLVMWAMLHYTRLMKVLGRAAERPVGYVASAVMLNAKLRPGMTLMHVVAMTRALGAQQSPAGQQPEVFRWTDGTQSHVTAEFRNGRVRHWTLWRPPQSDDAQPAAETPAP